MATFTARALEGLPPYGPKAISIPDPDAFREGYVVEFVRESSVPWLCNFRKLAEGLPSSIHTELGLQAIFVVAGGEGYVVNTEDRSLTGTVHGPITASWFQTNISAIVLCTHLWIEAHTSAGMLWRSRRISWDGIKIKSHGGTHIRGEAFDVVNDQWVPFTVDAKTGQVQGGAYPPELSESDA